MILSLYATYTKEENDIIVEKALQYNFDTFFTSLHFNEASALKSFLKYLKDIKDKHNFKYHADISPETLEKLDLKIENITQLKDYGIVGLRVDYGFSIEEMKIIASQNFEISYNASTLTKQQIEELKEINFIAWHNYYPRIETGISEEFFKRQNKMFTTGEFKFKVYAFIAGEKLLSAPLYKKLPTLEKHRYINSYVNYLELKLKFGCDEVVLSEGILEDLDFDMIMKFEEKNIITVPIDQTELLVLDKIINKTLHVRIEETDYSSRVEGTRGIIELKDEKRFSLEEYREKGSLFIDNKGYDRYYGELHIIKRDLKPMNNTTKVGKIKDKYKNIVDIPIDNKNIEFRN